jgi:nucleotide-binding universal stress UspA family protein
MYEVVIGVDSDESRAMACARAVQNLPGEATDVHVTVLHSFTDNPSGASATQVQSVREVTDYFDEHDVDYDISESSGAPADAIIETADELDADLIVLAGRKRSPAGKVLFGSVTQSVILETSRPVLVAEPEAVA